MRAFAAASGCILLLLWVGRLTSQGGASLRVSAEATQQNVPRIGINLGTPTSWGAEQLLANVVPNPGFEGNVDGALLSVSQASGHLIVDDSQGLARPTGFWEGGTFSVRSGKLAGLEGRILGSDPVNGYQRVELDTDVSAMAKGDIVAIRKISTGGLPAQWWFQNGTGGQVQTDPAQRRTGSQGAQSLHLTPASDDPSGVVSYIDALSGRAGKLLPLTGEWSAGIWLRGQGPSPQLRVTLRRQGGPAMLDQTVTATAGWTWHSWKFSPVDDGPAAIIEFRLEAAGNGNQVWVDDVNLSSTAAGDSAFRAEVTDTLRAFQPGYLRDWQGQLGDSFDNRIATQDGRKCTRYRPGDSEVFYNYSLPDLLALCHETGAIPWVVFPTTWTDDEWRRAGQFLESESRRYGFSEVVVEFGNENWNQLFRPAGVPNPNVLGAVAGRAFNLMRAAAPNAPLRFALGGWFGNNGYLAGAAASASAAVTENGISAVAPYYALSLPGGRPPSALLPLLFPDDRAAFAALAQEAAANGTEPAFYEMNAESLSGDALPGDASTTVTSAASGTALLYRSLRALDSGVRRQCLYSLAGFDTFRWSDGQTVRLFGLTRDLSTPSHFRPTGMAVALANAAIGGEYHRVIDQSGGVLDGVAAAAFRSNSRWSLVLASSLPRETTITVEFPAGTTLPRTVKTLRTLSPLSGNEDAALVRVGAARSEARSGVLVIHLPAYGVAVAQQ